MIVYHCDSGTDSAGFEDFQQVTKHKTELSYSIRNKVWCQISINLLKNKILSTHIHLPYGRGTSTLKGLLRPMDFPSD